jgi:uncharacterized membrane protein
MLTGRAAAICLLGLALRLFRIGAWGIGLDEAYSVSAAARGVTDLVRFVAVDDFHPPLYYLLLHVWSLLGTNEVLLRLPSVVFGVAAIWVLYKLGATIAGERVGLLAALILAVSPLHIYYSQEVRMYALLFLLGTASLYFFARGILGGHRRDWIVYAAVTLLALYTHYGALLVVLGENLAIAALLMFRRNPPLRAWVAVQTAVLAGYAPWLAVMATAYLRTSPTVVASLAAPAMVERLAYILAAFTADFLPPGTPLLKAAAVLLFGLAALAGGLALRRKPAAAIILLSASLGALAVAGLIVGSRQLQNVGTYVLIPRTTIVASAGYYVLIAAAVVQIRSVPVKALLLGGLLALNLYSYPHMYYGVVRAGPWRAVAEHVAANIRPGDGVVFVSGFWARPFDFYFLPRGADVPIVRYHSVDHLSRVRSLAAGSRRIWLVLKQPDAVDPMERVRTHLRSVANLSGEREFWDGIRVELYAH